MNARAWSRRALLVLVTCCVISPLALAASDNATLTIGSHQNCLGIASVEALFGFANDNFGSYSPTGLTGGKTVIVVWDHIYLGTCAGADNSVLEVSGFSTNPGESWLSSIECNGVTNTGSGATAFSYTGTTATWTWSRLFGFNGNNVGSNVSCTINHS